MMDVSIDEQRSLSVFVKRGAEAPITLWMNAADNLSAEGMMRACKFEFLLIAGIPPL